MCIIYAFEPILSNLPFQVFDHSFLLLLLLHNKFFQLQLLRLKFLLTAVFIQYSLFSFVSLLGCVGLALLLCLVFLVNFHFLDKVLIVFIPFADIVSQGQVLNLGYQLLNCLL